MQDIQRQAIAHAHDAISSAINALVGGAMFAPEPSRRRDLPGLVDTLREAEAELLAALEAAGVVTPAD